MGKIYTSEQKINGYECTYDFKMSPTAALDFFQESSQEQSSLLGLTAEHMAEQGLAWFLVKYQVEYKRYPRYDEQVIVETEPMAFIKYAAHRRFAIKDLEGELLIQGDSEWMLQNVKENRLQRLDTVPELAVYGADTETKTFNLRRLEKVEAWTGEKLFDVRYFDIDFNRHVGNVRYLAWALESLPFETVLASELAAVKIIFKQQAFYTDRILVRTAQLTEDTWRADIFNQDETTLCQLELTLRSREG